MYYMYLNCFRGKWRKKIDITDVEGSVALTLTEMWTVVDTALTGVVGMVSERARGGGGIEREKPKKSQILAAKKSRK